MHKELISIIVPIYNLESHLIWCLDSVAGQTYQNIEVILIDDGSTDSSGKICDEYCNRDHRFKVIHQKNKGIAGARNVGLKEFRGDFVCFVDGDDYIHPRMIEILYNSYISGDFSFSMVLPQETTKYISEFPMINNPSSDILAQKDLFCGFFGNSVQEKIYLSLWNKLYPRNLIEDELFNDMTCEDGDFNLRIFLKSNRSILTKTKLYYYVQRGDSITHQNVSKFYADNLDAYLKFYKCLSNEEYKSFCLLKMYKRLLNIRYTINSSQYDNYAKEKIKNVIALTWTDFIRDRSISFKWKCIISTLIYCPIIYVFFMWYCNSNIHLKNGRNRA